ncbi:hypothetical protein BJV74DRAFT_300581 [Russula compacta]|nr:hypothetical protein BJV74DRAFT_300581 [Russula compacta]
MIDKSLIHQIEFNGDNARPKRTDGTTRSARRSSCKGRAELGLGGVEREHEGYAEAKVLGGGGSVPFAWVLHFARHSSTRSSSLFWGLTHTTVIPHADVLFLSRHYAQAQSLAYYASHEPSSSHHRRASRRGLTEDAEVRKGQRTRDDIG